MTDEKNWFEECKKASACLVVAIPDESVHKDVKEKFDRLIKEVERLRLELQSGENMNSILIKEIWSCNDSTTVGQAKANIAIQALKKEITDLKANLKASEERVKELEEALNEIRNRRPSSKLFKHTPKDMMG